MIMSTFHREDAEAIYRIPLSQRDVSDSIIWFYNKSGKFYVKSAYKVARRIQGSGDAESSRDCAGKKIWPVLWKLRILNKIKVFGWRACHDILPTCFNLSRQRLLMRINVQYVPRNQNQPSTHYGSVLRSKISRQEVS